VIEKKLNNFSMLIEDEFIDDSILNDLAHEKKVRDIYNTIKKCTKGEDNYAYHKSLLNKIDISSPTLNKYLTMLLDAKLIEMSFVEIETSEFWTPNNGRKGISRTRKMWVRIFEVPQNENVRKFEEYLKIYQKRDNKNITS